MEDDLDVALALSMSKEDFPGVDEDEEIQRALLLSQQGSW